MVSNDTVGCGLNNDHNARVESLDEVIAYIQKLKYAIDSGAAIAFVPDRNVDRERDIRYTNRFTVNDLFPDENPAEALKRELALLKVSEYLCTVKDTRYKNSSEFRVFGKQFDSKDVYIKIRVDLIGVYGGINVLVLSFHYAEYPFNEDDYPYRHY